MFNRKKLTNLSKDDLAELIKRVELINQYLLVAQSLELQKRVWLNECLKKLGLDLNKRYEIDYKNGAIKEAKEPTKNEPTGNKTNS